MIRKLRFAAVVTLAAASLAAPSMAQAQVREVDLDPVTMKPCVTLRTFPPYFQSDGRTEVYDAVVTNSSNCGSIHVRVNRIPANVLDKGLYDSLVVGPGESRQVKCLNAPGQTRQCLGYSGVEKQY